MSLRGDKGLTRECQVTCELPISTAWSVIRHGMGRGTPWPSPGHWCRTQWAETCTGHLLLCNQWTTTIYHPAHSQEVRDPVGSFQSLVTVGSSCQPQAVSGGICLRAHSRGCQLTLVPCWPLTGGYVGLCRGPSECPPHTATGFPQANDPRKSESDQQGSRSASQPCSRDTRILLVMWATLADYKGGIQVPSLLTAHTHHGLGMS